MQTTVRSAFSGVAWTKPRFAVQRTSPFRIRLVLLSRGALSLSRKTVRYCEPWPTTFVVDGARWVPDPGAPAVDDGFGRRNSVLTL